MAKKPGCGEWRSGSEWNRRYGHEDGRKDPETKTPDPFSFFHIAFRRQFLDIRLEVEKHHSALLMIGKR
jgi:hypothetical protein